MADFSNVLQISDSTYTPTNNFYGVDSFTYKATDGLTTSTVATVRLGHNSRRTVQ